MRYVFLIVLCATVSSVLYAQTTVILIRHAEKASVASQDPELSAEGRERARELNRVLEEVRIDKIFSTPYKRTNETVALLANRLNLPVQEYDASALAQLATSLKGYSHQTILVVGHSNTTPALVNLLIGEGKYAELNEDDYDNLYIVNMSPDGATCVQLKYGRPDH